MTDHDIPRPVRVLVCGGRNYRDAARVYEVLTAFRRVHGIAVVIEGGADGADTFGYWWAHYEHIPSIREFAQWKKFGPAAGPIRNQKMLDEHHPDVVIAFDGRDGTRDMRSRAKKAGIPVLEGGAKRDLQDLVEEFIHPDSRHMSP